MTASSAKMDGMRVEEGSQERRPPPLAMATAGAGALLVAFASVTVLPTLGWYLLSSVTIALLIISYRPSWALKAVLVLSGLSLVVGFAARAQESVDPFHQSHDGGVVATEAAAEAVLDGTNPYTLDYEAALSPDHVDLDAVDDKGVPNPLIEHFPYLPAAFLVHVPFVALGSWYDPRLLYLAVTIVAVALVATGRQPSWRRAAAVGAIGANGAVAAYLPWGANDAAAASLVVIAAFVASRRPWLAGLLLALGISLKALLVVAVIPLGVVWLVRSRKKGFEALGVAAAALVLTCLPYAIASPNDFIDDTVRFNLGATDMAYPTSGVGLGAEWSELVNGPALLVLSAVLVLAAAGAAVWWVRRAPRTEVALFAAGVIVFAGLLPARSFQPSYFALLVLLWGPIWRLSAGEAGLPALGRTRH